MDIRRKLSRAYGKGDNGSGENGKDSDQKPVVRPVSWAPFSNSGENSDSDRQENRKKPAGRPAGLLKTVKDSDGVKKAAKFLLLLNKDDAAKIMRHFSEDELLQISAAMAEVRSVTSEEAKNLLQEFGFLKIPPHTSTGGVDVASAILTASFGKEKADEVLRKVVPFGGEKPFSFLEEYEAHQISTLLKKESPRVIALVLRFLSARKSSAVLKSLPVTTRVEVVRRLGRMDKVDNDALDRMQTALREKIRSMGKVVTQEVDGPSTLAAILKHLSLDHEDSLLRGIEETNPELGKEIKEKVYTLDLLLNISDKELQDVLRTHPDEEVARMLKGRDMRVSEKVLHNLSARRRQMVEDEIERLGSIPRREADEAAREFLDYLMRLSDQGLVHFVDRDEIIS
jgi:flagellar motor switch protein FliG